MKKLWLWINDPMEGKGKFIFWPLVSPIISLDIYGALVYFNIITFATLGAWLGLLSLITLPIALLIVLAGVYKTLKSAIRRRNETVVD